MSTTTKSPMLEAAEAALDKGFSVFDLSPATKIPRPGTHGHLDATALPAEVEKLWTDNPEGNPAISCPASNLVVLDYDDGIPPSDLPKTYTVKTTRGLHLYYWGQMAGTKLYDLNGKKVGELKSADGYVLAAGARHPSGVIYSVADDSPIAEAPMEIIARITKKSATDSHPASVTGDVIPRGSHDIELHRIAGRLRHDGLEEEAIFDALVEVCEKRCEHYGSDYLEMCRKHAHNICEKSVGTGLTLTIAGRDPETGVQVSQPPTPTSKPAVDVNEITRLQKEYDSVGEESEQEEKETFNSYPIEAWEGTPYSLFAKIAGQGNNIPPEYFINGLATFVGAICGHRVIPKHNSKLEMRHYTVFLSPDGGAGKNTVIDWTKDIFESSKLLLRHGLAGPFKNIGTYKSSFASERATLKAFMKHSSILQEYAEFTTLLEKTGIAGSGSSFRDLILNLADSTDPSWSEISDQKIPADAPTALHNSIIAGSTVEKWEKAGGMVEDPTFIQRLNLVPSGSTRPKGILDYPDLTEIRKAVLPRIGFLETHKLIWTFSDEARRVFEEWFEDVMDRRHKAKTAGEGGASEAYGRINVFALRIIGHLALWFGEAPDDMKGREKHLLRNGGIPCVFNADGEPEEFGDDEPDGKVWEVVVTPELVHRAIKISEHQIQARLENLPVSGLTYNALCENHIKKWMVKLRWATYGKLCERAGLYKYGLDKIKQSLRNLDEFGLIRIVVDPLAPERRAKWKIIWLGDGTKRPKWIETRGGKRPGSGRKTQEGQNNE